MAIERLPRIKVCGLRGLEDLPAPFPSALDAVGFVGWVRSPRQISADSAARIVEALPPRVLPVAVLVAPSTEEAERYLRVAGARVLQLCGDESPEDWTGFPFPILRRIAVDDGALDEMDAWQALALGFVLDHPAAPGGTGVPVAIERARVLAARGRCLLAGGLRPENVTQLVHSVRPFGVDASSKLEGQGSRKDPARVLAFVAAAAAALASEERER